MTTATTPNRAERRHPREAHLLDRDSLLGIMIGDGSGYYAGHPMATRLYRLNLVDVFRNRARMRSGSLLGRDVVTGRLQVRLDAGWLTLLLATVRLLLTERGCGHFGLPYSPRHGFVALLRCISRAVRDPGSELAELADNIAWDEHIEAADAWTRGVYALACRERQLDHLRDELNLLNLALRRRQADEDRHERRTCEAEQLARERHSSGPPPLWLRKFVDAAQTHAPPALAWGAHAA
ncbi:hypothetical protein BN12_2200002 [Nostocoides japonicum T1-X7]|uniref:Uncharacterized protein n=1 Tax=Nostocoides japonicum T1-X7 TaxID=1194083 RepID=A0A077LVP9_9MICO|nr:hypothetical protein [Tetrasphaera japonica]CCH77761.1 hypothetical protein BN12_2200002 [Tetrasphaera japonica T1-X7]